MTTDSGVDIMFCPILTRIKLSLPRNRAFPLLAVLFVAIAFHAHAAAPNKAPTVTIAAPANGATFPAGSNITVTANAADSDGTIAKVDFYRGATILLGTDTTSPYSFVWANVPAGSYSLTVTATDNLGAVKTSSAVAITVMNSPPSVAIVSPTAGAPFAAPASVTIAANASDSDGAVSKVEFFQTSALGGTNLVGTSLSSPFTVTWSNVPIGSYTLTAKATDNLGAAMISPGVNITVSAANLSPLVVLTAPAPCTAYDAPATIVFNADALDPDGSIAKVEFLQGATVVSTTTTASPYFGTWPNVPPGVYSLLRLP